MSCAKVCAELLCGRSTRCCTMPVARSPCEPPYRRPHELVLTDAVNRSNTKEISAQLFAHPGVQLPRPSGGVQQQCSTNLK